MIQILKIRFSPTISRLLLVTLTLSFALIQGTPAMAATITSFSDTVSRLKASTASNHEIKFVTPTGVAAGQTIIFTFTGFGTVTNLVNTDIDFAEGDSANCTTASFTEKTLASTASGATWGADGDSSTTVTLTSGTGTVTANRCLRVRIGTNAVSQTTGSNQITNGSVGTGLVAITGTFGDTGTAGVPIISEDTVSVTATVDPTITFNLFNTGDSAIGFGSLTVGAARWANAAATGSASDTSSHQFTVATNAASGYVVTYNGASLTKGSDVIDPLTSGITDDADGTPGTEQFGISLNRQTGDGTVATGYDNAGIADWKFVAGATTTIYSESVPTATEAVDVHYIANVAGNTPAGSYSTSITFSVTATF